MGQRDPVELPYSLIQSCGEKAWRQDTFSQAQGTKRSQWGWETHQQVDAEKDAAKGGDGASPLQLLGGHAASRVPSAAGVEMVKVCVWGLV